MPPARRASRPAAGLQVPAFADREQMAQALDRWRRWPPWRAWRRLRRPTTDLVGALADAVYSSPHSAPFSFDVVGSFTELGSSASDVDLIVRAKPDASHDWRDVEEVMIAIEHFGLNALRISIDTTFRELSEGEMSARTRDGRPFPSVKLYAARWRKLAAMDPQAVRRVSRHLVEVRRSIERTSYFEKLPYVEGAGGRHRGYREAVPLRDYARPS